MQSPGLQVLERNIIVVFKEPIPRAPDLQALFDEDLLAVYMKPPLNVSQILMLEQGHSAALPGQQVQSIRGGKSVTLSPVRLEVHDYVADGSPSSSSTVDFAMSLIERLGLTEFRALGTNAELEAHVGPGGLAVSQIKDKLFGNLTFDLGDIPSPDGMSARLYFTGPNGIRETLTVEPRFNDPSSDRIWMTWNIQSAPTVDEVRASLAQWYERAYDRLNHVARRVLE